MKIDLNAPILNRLGTPMKDGTADATIRTMLWGVIDTPQETDRAMSQADALRLAVLGNKMVAAEAGIELSAADATLLLDRAHKMGLPIVVYGQLVAALDPAQLGE